MMRRPPVALVLCLCVAVWPAWAAPAWASPSKRTQGLVSDADAALFGQPREGERHAGRQLLPEVAADGEGWLVSWRSERLGLFVRGAYVEDDLWTARVDSTGKVGEPRRLVDANAIGDAHAIVATSDGFAIAWRSRDGLFLSRTAASGDPVAEPVAVAGTEVLALACASDDGCLVIVRQSSLVETELHAVHVDRGGVTTDRALSIDIDSGIPAAVVPRSDGYVALWVDDAPGNPHTGPLLAQRLDLRGALVGTAESLGADVLSSSLHVASTSRAIAVLGGGWLRLFDENLMPLRAPVAWQAGAPESITSQGEGFRVLTSTSDGYVLHDVAADGTIVARDTMPPMSEPRLAGSGDATLVAWTPSYNGPDVYVSLLDSVGRPGEATLASHGPSSQCCAHVLAFPEHALVVFQDLDGIAGVRLDAKGCPLAEPSVVLSEDGSESIVDAASTEKQAALLVDYTPPGGDRRFYLVRVTPEGVATEALLLPDRSWYDGLAASADRIVVLSRQQDEGTALEVTPLGESGNVGDVILAPTAEPDTSIMEATVASDGSSFLAVVARNAYIANAGIDALPLGSDGAPSGPPTELAPSGSDVHVIWERDAYLVSWSDYSDSTGRLTYARRIGADGTPLDDGPVVLPALPEFSRWIGRPTRLGEGVVFWRAEELDDADGFLRLSLERMSPSLEPMGEELVFERGSNLAAAPFGDGLIAISSHVEEPRSVRLAARFVDFVPDCAATPGDAAESDGGQGDAGPAGPSAENASGGCGCSTPGGRSPAHGFAVLVLLGLLLLARRDRV